ncbi:MAG: hypothetical protein KDD02_11355 [Phaeodactylibacter sp.]|nr:hypothetical protein [Phaeodactylibacter sp.]
MHGNFAWVIVFVSICLAAGCNLSSLEDRIVVPDVEDEFYLDLWESLTPQGRFLEFRLRTIENEDCLNASIDHEIRQVQGNIALSINEVQQSQECVPGQAPASANARVGILQSGFYTVEVGLRKTVSTKGQLILTPDNYNLSLDSGGGVVLLHSQLKRIPEQSIWGYVSYENDGLKDVAQNLVQDILARCELQSLKNGYYGYFTIEDGTLRLPNTVAPEGAFSFQYRLVESKENIQALLESYRSEYGDQLTVKVFNTLGEEW